MTIISTAPEAPHKLSTAPEFLIRDNHTRSAFKVEEPTSPISPRSVPTRSFSKFIQRRPQPTALVEEFIQSFKDLQAYK